MCDDRPTMRKLAVRTVLERFTLDGEPETKTVYDIEAPPGSLHDSDQVTQYVLGYVEHPQYQTVDRQDSFAAFVEGVESQASDHYWFKDRLTDSERAELGGDGDA